MNKEKSLTFEEVATVAQTAKHDSAGDFDSRAELRVIVGKLTNMYDLGARDGVAHDLTKIRNFLKQEIQASKFSDRYKRQLCGTIDTFTDIDDLTMWLLSETG
jgi:hypothetical protein